MPTASPIRPDGDGDGREARRVVVDPGGPVLVEGPVEVTLPDGRTVRSDRFMVALCACRRSRSHPWCDTSHRRHTRGRAGSSGGRPAEAEDGPDGRGGNAGGDVNEGAGAGPRPPGPPAEPDSARRPPQ